MKNNRPDINLDAYRKDYESEEHWNLRKWFMSHHWDRINDEDELLCCAQLFVNIEFLGCRYASELMRKIQSMADEVPQIRKHRDSRKDKLKRTFVTAKDAVQAKYAKTMPKTSFSAINDTNSRDKIEWNKFVQETSPSTFQNHPSIKLSETQRLRNLRSLLKDVLVFESSDENDFNYCINKTTACMRKIGKLDVKYDADTSKYLYVFNDQIIAEGSGESKKAAKKAADEDFVATLRANCYTIRSKLKFYSGEDVVSRNSKTSKAKTAVDQNQIKQDNLGFKLLAKLGWKGGSLGSTGTGIIDPINLEIKIGRNGLGSDLTSFDKKYFRNLLQNFKQNQVEYDLIFSPEFDKDERAQIHQIAAQLNLRTKSYGKDSSRHLVISTRISPQVLREKLIEGDDYLKEKYELIPPSFVRPNS